MADLCFPQLSTGALAQYPFRKTRLTRNIRNTLPDGSIILQPDPSASRINWELAYSSLSIEDVNALSALFRFCCGRKNPFTYIDPADNMLTNSSNLLSSAWSVANLIQLTSGVSDPKGGQAGFLGVNQGQTIAECTQTLAVPTGYRYAFSTYVSSAEAGTLELVRRGLQAEVSTQLQIGPQWTRIVTSGTLPEQGMSITVAIRLESGQRVSLFGPQLEAQPVPSRYRPTFANGGGVYANAHWAVDEVHFSADAPGLFSSAFSVEANL